VSGISLADLLHATGYYPDGAPAPGLLFGEAASLHRRGHDFKPDAMWRSSSSLSVYFKFEEKVPPTEVVATWRREIWNEGFAPLLWVICPERIDLYNGFGAPILEHDAEENRIRTFAVVESSLREADALAGRLSIETGQLWQNFATIDRKTSVDHRLLYDLHHLEKDLVTQGFQRNLAQALIGRVIFTQYLLDRGIVTPTLLKTIAGGAKLPDVLRQQKAATQLFSWLSKTFNGDMFPPSSADNTPENSLLNRVADFLEAVNPETGQTTLFPYRFDVIPVELISSIYEQFAHAQPATPQERSSEAERNGVHYTRLSLVSLVLDEVMEGVAGKETVLDLTCGSGVFLVEALRRLVALRGRNEIITRDLIRDVLYNQVFGADISETAIRVAAFSLYLAALELDPDPQPPQSLKFQPLIGRTLVCGDARTIEQRGPGREVFMIGSDLRKFDVIVGNPPWGFKGKTGTAERKKSRGTAPSQPRGEGLDFVLRAIQFSHDETRFGVVLSAIPFFSRSNTGIAAALHVMKLLAPITVVNLANLSGWLFATATMPAVILFARHRAQPADQVTVVQIPWSTSGARTQTFEVSPNDINRLRLGALEAYPLLLKAAAVGVRRDVALVEAMFTKFRSLGQQLSALETELNVGMIRGFSRNQTRSAGEMRGLPLLEAGDLRPFKIPKDLGIFDSPKAQWPRARGIYKAPLLVVKETLNGGPRLLTAVSERDLVYTNAFFGAALPRGGTSVAHLLAAILSSSFAAWFFLMSASEFGIWKRRVLRDDVARLPLPEISDALSKAPGKKLVSLSKSFSRHEPGVEDLEALDEVVFDLYGLDSTDRVVAQNGLQRATWQWQSGREESAAPASIGATMTRYSNAFMSVLQGWLSVRGEKTVQAEIYDLPDVASLRIIRFVITRGPRKSASLRVPVAGTLKDLIEEIGSRLNKKIATALTATRELRVYGKDEVFIIKPAATRHWMEICALEDADAVVSESFRGRKA